MTQAAWAGRMAGEKYELIKRIEKLEHFIRTPAFEQLPRQECDDLHEQLSHMQAYHAVLQRRYDRIPPTGPDHLAQWELGRDTP
jgi:hypothetical protein